MDKSSKGKNKGKGREKYDSLKHYSSKWYANDASKHKPKYPCLICADHHYTKDFPLYVEVNCLLKGT